MKLIVDWTNAYLNNEDITNKQIDDFFLKIKDNILNIVFLFKEISFIECTCHKSKTGFFIC